jgi:protein-S-isoprenylcysteine O-methyltransferase Ste14
MAQPDPVERGARVRFPPPLVFLGATLVGVAFDSLVAPAPVSVGRPIALVLGLLILACGVALVVSARIHFTRTGQSPVPWRPSPSLIFSGPYRFSRNPMYLGVTLVELGLGLALGNLWISLFAAPALLIVHLIAVLPEERYLAEKFGAPYRAYLTRVRRYL